jgi:PAS domain S-box-containing protein
MHQDAFDLVTEGALWVTSDGAIQNANEQAATLLGYSRNALLKANYFEINPHFSRMGWKRFWNRLQSNTNERLDTEFVNNAGKLVSVRGRVGFDIYSIDPELCLVVFQATEAGKRDEDLLRVVQEDGFIGAWEVNLTTNRVYISPPIRGWLGLSADRGFYPCEEFLALLQRCIQDDPYQNVRLAYKELLRGSGEAATELKLAPPGGAPPARYRIKARSVENELEIYKVYGTLRPATGEESPTHTPDVGKGLLQAALDRQNDAVYIVEYKSRRVRYVNDRALEIMGYTRKELIGLKDHHLTTEEEQDKLDGLYRELRSIKFMEVPATARRKDGSRVAVLARAYYHESAGEEFLVMVSRENSGDSPRTDDAVLYATTLDALNEWVIWLDLNNKVVMVNEAARRKLRRKTSLELEGRPIADLMPDLAIPSLSDIRQEQLDGRFRAAVDYVWANTSGDDRTLQVRFAQVAASDHFYLCLICRDVTLQYLNKRKLQKTKRRVDELTKQLRSENETLRQQVEQVSANSPIITVSRKYQQILAQIAQVADTDATVLVTGETGTGKELLAQSIHTFSSRGRKPLVSVNCAALPENLIESELFGHERGAFTGAHAQKKGKFELADRSTIFLDEIGELPLDMQAKLLRVLQEGEIQRIGSTESISVDVRVVAATNRDLERMINEGTFREDLFYRLNVFPIHNPPLRDRPEDIPVLINHFTKVYADRMGRNITHINQKDIDRLKAYEFPGNVRELINLVERAVITTRGDTLNLEASLQALRRPDPKGESRSFRGERIISFEAMQRQYIIAALQRTNGKVTGPGGAAELLQLNGRTLMSKMNKFGIDRNKFTG